jgi:hypothetical protein
MRQDISAVPHALGHDNHASLGDLALEIPTQAFDSGGRGFDETTSRAPRSRAKRVNTPTLASAIEHHIAGSYGHGITVVNV